MKKLILMLALALSACAGSEDEEVSQPFCRDPAASAGLPYWEITEAGEVDCRGADRATTWTTGDVLLCEWYCVSLACEPGTRWYVSHLFALTETGWRPAVGGTFIERAGVGGTPSCR